MKKINIIGLGNILFGDEGFGVEAVRLLESVTDYPDNVSFIDGGTQGLYLLDYIESCDAVLVFDSIIPREFEPKVYLYTKDELPAFIHRKMSSHQMGLSELLSIALLHGKMPEKLVMIGAPPFNLDLGSGLSEQMTILLHEAVEKAQTVITTWLEE